jgi:SAM-dependent methyltransferase
MDWQAHALARLVVEDSGPAPARSRMFWGRWPETGPGAEILGDLAGKHIAEIGCGPGHHLAHLVAHHGIAGLGIDSAPAQIQRAHNKYGHLPGIIFTNAEAAAFLTTTSQRFDIVISVFGALSFTDPDLLLPTIRPRLAPRGLLAFSVRDDRLDEPDAPAWYDHLAAAGFEAHSADRLPDGTLLITARPAHPSWHCVREPTMIALLLDIDGVFIPFPDAEGNGPPTHTRHDVVPTGYDPTQPVPIWLDPAVGALIAEFLLAEPVEAVWASSWQVDADPIIGRRLGLPPLGYIPLGRPAITTSHPHGYLWKRDPVSAWLGDRPAAWIDDDFTGLDHKWAADRNAAGIPTLLVQPNPRLGLLAEHLTMLHTWLPRARTAVTRHQ